MHFIWAVVIGIIAGTITNRLRPGHDRRRATVDFAVGLVAAVAAFLIGRVLHFRAAGGGLGMGLYISIGITWLMVAIAGWVVVRRTA